MATRTMLAVAAIAAAASAAATPPLRFETVFAAAGEPPRLHFRAAYAAGGGAHTLEVWRDGDRRVKRVTDGRVTTLAAHDPGSAEFGLTIVDPGKRTITTIDRTNLYRLGNFTDWFDLTHGLRHPKGGYTLVAAAAPAGAPAPVAACRWYDLTAAARTTHVCWSAASRLPLVIAAPGATWRVTAIDRDVPASTFAVPGHGFVRVDANRDLDRD